jgi:fermentation-respiration switch protein FrsA (DUF1100 family)
LLLSLIFPACSSLFFYPDRQLYENPAAQLLSPQDVYFRTADGLTLHGWFFRTRPEAKATIFVLHGNAENISTHVNAVLWLVNEGFNVFIFDYRGYGKSEGKPTVQGIHRDAEAAFESVMTLPGSDPDRIIVVGQSLGGAVAVSLVSNSRYKQRVKALIIDSSFSSYRRIAREKMNMLWLTWPFQYPLSWFFDDSYSPVKKIADVSPVPVLILHGMCDPVVPAHHGELLFAAAREPKELWLTTPEGHTRSLFESTVRERLKAYLMSHVKKP